MPDERHEQNNDRDDIGWLRARVADGEEERTRMAAAAMSERSQMRAEVAMLRARLSDIVAMLAAQQQAAETAAAAARAEGWRSGYDQRAAEESQVPPPRAPGVRHLRIVSFAPAAGAAGRVLLRHKVVLLGAAALVTAAVAVPAWHTAEFRVAVPGHGAGPSVVAQAFAPQGRPSSPPGQGKSPSPGSSHGHGHGSPPATPPGHASPSPSPGTATADPGTPDPSPSPDPGTTGPDPSGTPAPACTPAA